jgi:c-di-GMP-related signal transduction protein
VATDPDAATTLTYSISGGADASKFSIDSVTGALSFVAAPNFEAPTDTGSNNVYEVIVQASDGSLTDTQAIAVTVTNANEAPTITSNGGGANAAVSSAENTKAVTTVVATDPDASTTLTYSISGGVDASKFSIDSVSGALSFVTAPNFEAPTDTGANNVYDVIVQASDGSLTDTQTIAVTVTNANEAPTITTAGAFSITENTKAVTTVVATDPDASTTLVYSISGGADASKFSIDSVTGALSFVAAPNFETPTDTGGNNVYDVIVQASDGSLTDTQAIAVTVTNANEAPTITTGGAFSIAENTKAVTTVVATDPDASTTLVYSISGGVDASKFSIDSVTGALSFVMAPNFEAPADTGSNNVYDVIVQASDGSLTDTQAIAVTVTNANEAPTITTGAAFSIAENTKAVTTVVATDPDASTTLTYTISGGVDASKFSIDSVSGALSFVTASNFEAPTDTGGNNVYDVIVQASDGSLSDTQAIAVTVTNVNEAPTITTGGAFSIAENTKAVTTIVATDPDAATTLVYSISGGADASKFSIDSVTGALSFVSAPNFEAPTDTDANNVFDVIVQASDGSLTDTQAIAVTVTNANEAPTITTGGAFSIAENTKAVTTVVATDPDASTTLVYSISGGADASKFSIDSVTGALSFVTAPNFEAPTDTGSNNVYDVIVQASDGSLTDTQAIAVTVTNANEAPTITTGGGVSIAENTKAVTTVVATDPDAATTLTYSISGGADASKFSIDSVTGALSFVTAPNFEAPTDIGGDNVYDVIVQASDGSLSDTQAIAVTVTDVDEGPGAITDSNAAANSVAENAANGTKVGITAFADDPDAGDNVSYTLTDDAGGRFAVNSLTGEVTVANGALLDFDTKSSHDVTVKATSSGGDSTKTFTITLTDVNEGPGAITDANAAANTVAENAVLGAVVGITAFADDPDAGDDVTYSLVDNAGGRFAIDSNTGEVTVANGLLLDFEVDNSHNITVRASSPGGTKDQLFTIAVADVSDENITGNAGANSFTGGAGNDTMSGLDNNDTLIGGGGDDSLVGGSDDDVLNGDAGNDTLIGGAGDDFLDGGEDLGDADTADYRNAGGVTVSLSENFAFPDGDGGQDTLAGIENVQGSDFGDSITGDGFKNVLLGFLGDDFLAGGGDDDWLVGAEGSDTLVGGAGADTLTGSSGSDLLDYDDIADAGDTSTDFEIGAGNDAINIADLLVGYSGDGSDLDDLGFVELAGDDGATTIRVDADGSAGGGAVFVDLVLLDGVDVNSISVDALVADGNLIPT